MNKSNLKNRTIYCKDNIEILKGINSNSVDLIYLDPPFNKNKTFSAPIGSSSEGATFRDTFREEDVKAEWVKDIEDDYTGLHNFLNGIKELNNITESRSNKHYLYNYCYLCYMAIRLVEMRRVLKETGSIYLHCDNTMGHYLKILMDIIFGEKNFRNEIIWCYRGAGYPKKDFGKRHDILFRYTKTIDYIFNLDSVREEYADSTKERFKHYIGNKRKSGDFGIQTLNPLGKHPDDWWQMQPISPSSKERTGYPTQKPIALLERIIKASSKEGDIVLDPFCGCATTCIASEKLGRQWIGIDVSQKAYELVKERLNKEVQGIGKQGNLDVKTELKNDYDKLTNFQTDPPKRTDVNGDDGIIKKYVYIVSHPKHKGYYKVGVSKDTKARLSDYQTGDPKRAYKLEYHFLTSHFREIEKHIHKRFDNSFEWVRAGKEEIIKEIEGYK